jgi:peptidoglycan/LPS O-acetylase OafA/YrhL
VFFALSGFLITTMLLQESALVGRVSLRCFYARRARRLLPALCAYLGFWVVLTAAGVGPFTVTYEQVLAAAVYLTNWLMASDVPVANPVAITWSLSIEEQFYTLWPLLLTVTGGRRRPLVVLALTGIAYSAAARVAPLDGSGLSWGEIYYRTDTRFDSLLLGCLLGIFVTGRGEPDARWRYAAPLGLVGLGALTVWPSDAVRYAVVPAGAALASCALITAVLAGGCRWLCASPLRWIGRRSYALYLWHYPIFVAVSWGKLGFTSLMIAVALSFVAAETSWWLVERPFCRRKSAETTARQASVPAGKSALSTRPGVELTR